MTTAATAVAGVDLEGASLRSANQPQEPLLKGDGTMPDDATLLNWLEASSGAHSLNPTQSKTVRFSFAAKTGLRHAIAQAMYDEAAHEAQRRGWEYEPEDGTWRKDGYLQCVEEALVATISAQPVPA
jgi:hypothetical protein